jgi:ADP-heptose:LPS heptosyltransferase
MISDRFQESDLKLRDTEKSGNNFPWINPIGGYGDMLMVAGVLRQVVEQNPSRRFNLVRRTRYSLIFENHEAIAKIGFPNQEEQVQRVDYWAMEELGPGPQRPYQILARGFGLKTPIEERLYLPGALAQDPFLDHFLPWKKLNVVIAPASDSPRKMMNPLTWHRLVDFLLTEGAFVMQVGLLNEQHIRNAYSVRGMTTPQQLVALLRKCNLVISSDNFIMHAAHMAGRPAVVVWGPTPHEVYGYPEQIHLQASPNCNLEKGESCIVSYKNQGGKLYGTPCPLGDRHCVNQIRPEELYEACKRSLL